MSLLLVVRLVGEYRDTAAESDRETEALAQLVSSTSRELEATNRLLDAGDDDVTGFQTADGEVVTQFLRASTTFDERDYPLIAAARAQWVRTYAPVRAATVDAAHVDAFLASLRAPGATNVHAALGADQQQLTALLSRIDEQVHVESRDGLVAGQAVERDVFLVFVAISVALVALVLTLANRLQHRVIAPVHALAQAAHDFGEGDLTRRAGVHQDDEIGELAETFDRMADAIAAQHDELRRQAFHDPLTGLTRRPGLVEQEGVLFIDLDDFKRVNDTMGHAAGDRLLQQVAERLVAAVRESDVVARLGGDEFAVMVAHPVGEDSVLAIAERVREALATPFELGGRAVTIGASIGVALRDVDPTDDDLLLRAADAVMYVAKGLGKNRVEVFDPAEHAHLLTGDVTPGR